MCEYEIDWAAVAAIGQWVGSIATFLAVFVALKVANDASKIKLKILIYLGKMNFHSKVETALYVHFINVGNISTNFWDIPKVTLPDGKELECAKLFGSLAVKKLGYSESSRLIIPFSELIPELKAKGYSQKVKLNVSMEDSHKTKHDKSYILCF